MDVSRPVGLKRQGQVYCDAGSPFFFSFFKLEFGLFFNLFFY